MGRFSIEFSKESLGKGLDGFGKIFGRVLNGFDTILRGFSKKVDKAFGNMIKGWEFLSRKTICNNWQLQELKWYPPISFLSCRNQQITKIQIIATVTLTKIGIILQTWES